MTGRLLRRGLAVGLAIGVAVAWLLLGGAVGLATAVLSGLGWGLVLGVAATVALAVAAPAGVRARIPLAVGWVVVVLRLSLRRPEGDYVVAGDVGGYVVLVLGVVLLTGALVTVPRPRTPPAS